MTTTLDHSWTFNAADCANRRIAEYRETDRARASRERDSAFNLQIMATKSFAIANPIPVCADGANDELYLAWEESCAQWDFAFSSYLELHLGFNQYDSRYVDWYYRLKQYRLNDVDLLGGRWGFS